MTRISTVLQWRVSIVAVLASALLIGGCGGDETEGGQADGARPEAGTGQKDGPTTLDVSLLERAIAANPSSAKAGKVTFNVSNNGGTKHELVVIRTDLGITELPVAKSGAVNERAEDLEVVGELEDVQPTASGKLRINLEPGNHVLICNFITDLGGGEKYVHYAEGMRTALKVE